MAGGAQHPGRNARSSRGALLLAARTLSRASSTSLSSAGLWG